MSDLLTIAGSPSHPSRSAAVLAHIRTLATARGLVTDALHVRDLDATDLLTARFDGPSIRASVARVQQARAVVIATPVYKASFAGALKTFLDLLPQDGLAGKLVFPIATGGSPAHLLAIDYALKPVLYALGAQQILGGLYIQDAQLHYANGSDFQLDAGIEARLQGILATLFQQLEANSVVRQVELVPA